MADVSDVKPSDLKEITDSLEGLSCKLITHLCSFRIQFLCSLLTYLSARILTRVLY